VRTRSEQQTKRCWITICRLMMCGIISTTEITEWVNLV